MAIAGGRGDLCVNKVHEFQHVMAIELNVRIITSEPMKFAYKSEVSKLVRAEVRKLRHREVRLEQGRVRHAARTAVKMDPLPPAESSACVLREAHDTEPSPPPDGSWDTEVPSDEEDLGVHPADVAQ
jgi:hypothetical protein